MESYISVIRWLKHCEILKQVNAEVISYEQYLDEAKPHDIFKCEQALAGSNKVFIISAFPEFLVDYFGMKLWRTCVKHAKNQLDICNCK